MNQLPPVAAVFLTHFEETKGQSVVYYRSYDEARLPSGTMEHSSLPSGLHSLDDDLFGFRHGSLPAVALFRNRDDVGSSKRGRRMASLGVVLADEEATEDVFRLGEALGEVFDRIEALRPSAFRQEGQAGLNEILDGAWRESGSEPVRGRSELDTHLPLDSAHPLSHLPVLVDRLGPKFMTLYKAALSGRRILLYAQPPLLPVSAYAWCISAMSLPPRALDGGGSGSEWAGQVGLMDIDTLSKRPAPWVATTSDKILLSHTKLYDLSLDLSSPEPEITSTYPPPPRSMTYAFSDIPLYRTLQAISTAHPTGGGGGGRRTDDWWLTLYGLLDTFWAVCAGVCEYAVGRGRVGAIALSSSRATEQGDEDARLLHGDDDDGESINALAGERESDEMATRGRLIMRQLYHNTHHLHARLREVDIGAGDLTSRQARELTGQWVVSKDEIQFWTTLARHWASET